MPVLSIVHDTEILHRKARRIYHTEESLVRLAVDMLDTMHAVDGIGLAANQVGASVRMIVVDVEGVERVLLNPEITFEGGRVKMWEGCLSLPNSFVEIERAKVIYVAYKDLLFKDIVMRVDGMLARAILHEVDHLNGILITDYVRTGSKLMEQGATC